jgi:hypothetical protein
MKVCVGLPLVTIGLLLCAFRLAAEPPALSPKAAKLVADWRVFYAEQKALAVSAPPKSLAEEFDRRIVLDQGVRNVFSRNDITAEEQKAIVAAIDADWRAIDDDNDAFVKRSLPPDGWFKFSRDGKTVGHDAWLIVQHSPDREFQRKVLLAMTPLVKAGEASGPEYALLYDRTEMFAGRPQRFGSQGVCKDGKLTIYTLEDEARVDERRHEIGLTQTLEEYKKVLGIGRDC